ncbi:MAG TPA: GTPase domain-containing protein [Thermoanaerobaculaceae bacterium]|nr:GTPase domain-containing protein [Thermoanaerobaculaceae bacterium]
MVFFNWATMQMAAKIVYYGPGLCGKTTNLSFIYTKTAPGSRGEMVSLETETDRTLFFDLLPIEVGKVGGFRTRLQLYTVPGQVFYNTTRKLVLKGVDGMVFVADSQRPMADANIESLENLTENLTELGLAIDTLPIVMQYNKRDLKNVLTLDELNSRLNPDGRWDYFESVATDGTGVFETLKAITKLTLRSLRRRMTTHDGTGVPLAASGVPTPPGAPSRHPVAFSPAALAAAAAEGLGTLASSPAAIGPDADEAPRPELQTAEAADVRPAAAAIEDVVQPAGSEAPKAEAAAASADDTTAEFPAAEEAEEIEEAGVEFATTPEAEPEAVETEMRHVKVSSSLDILAELETLRKSSTYRPEPRPIRESAPAFDLDALLRGSLNSRQEVKRRVDEQVGSALDEAHRCLVNIQLVDGNGRVVRDISPLEVELKRGGRIRHLALTLLVNLQGE